MIKIDEKNKQIHIAGSNVSYVMRVNEFGLLENAYFGARISEDDVIMLNQRVICGMSACVPGIFDRTADENQMMFEYPSYGQGDYRNPAIYIVNGDGSRITDLRYKKTYIGTRPNGEVLPFCDGGETLVVELSDDFTGITAKLYYTVYEQLNAITRSVIIENHSEESVKIEKVMSFSIDMQNENYDKVILHGNNQREFDVERTSVERGIFKIDSKRGITSATLNPFLAICEKGASENNGKVYAFNLIYSGNFEMDAELSEFNSVRVNGGINSFGFSWTVNSGDKFVTPEAVMVYTEKGFNGMSHIFHDLYRSHLINKNFVTEHRPIVINNWEATYFSFNTKKLKAIIDVAEKCGIDTFVLDDGWFGKRNDDTTSLGDWYVNTQKLPGGLKEISDYCHIKNMKFGLWIEPEMISDDSELNRQHPDWKIQIKGREHCIGRGQCVLDITRDEVRDYLKEIVSSLIKENNIDYIKWDMNRSLTENVSYTLPGERQGEFFHRYVLGVYDMMQFLTVNFPNVIIEGCSSGGSRFDAGILKYCPQIWTSDNSEAYARSQIQYGGSYCYPLSAMSCHVSACPNHQTGRTTSLATRGHIAHLGATGYELDITTLGDQDLQIIADQVDEYKKIERLILCGDVYRLKNQATDGIFAEEIVAKDKGTAIVTAMRSTFSLNRENVVLRLLGLEENALYKIEELNIQKTGSYLMTRGIMVKFEDIDFASVTYSIVRI